MKHDLGAPRALTHVAAPALAFGRSDAFHSGSHEWPRSDADYRTYRRVGRMPAADFEYLSDARAAAREKYGPRVNVFETARYWVVYEIR